MSKDEAFRSRIEVVGDCWIWRGATAKGYGVFKFHGVRMGAHRYSLMSVGFNLDGLFVDHLCHQTLCVRPSHLRPADNAMNQQNLKGPRSSSKSGVLGVSWDQDGNRWRAAIQSNGATYRRSFKDLAAAATWAARTRERVHYPKLSPAADGSLD